MGDIARELGYVLNRTPAPAAPSLPGLQEAFVVSADATAGVRVRVPAFHPSWAFGPVRYTWPGGGLPPVGAACLLVFVGPDLSNPWIVSWAAAPSSATAGLPMDLEGATAGTRYVGATTSGAPSAGTFAVGDLAVDQSGAVWICTVAGSPGTWTPGYQDALGKPLGLTGASAATRYVGATTSGAPSSGTFAVGDYAIDQTGGLWICTGAGTPGTWVQGGGLGLPLALTGATAATRYAGGTAAGAPASGTFDLGDFVVDQSGAVWVCTTAGTPGTWTKTGGTTASGLPGGWVDVKAAGAKGDGTTDDTAAINAAIAGSAVGDTIWFPPGTYKTSAAVVLYPSRTYLGAGGVVGQTTITATSAVTGAVLAGQGWYNSTLTACDAPIRLQGIKVVGPGKGTGTAAGIALTSFWCRIEDVFVEQTGSHGILLTDVTRGGSALTTSSGTCSENTIFKCKIDSVGGDGVHVGNQASFNTNQDGAIVDCLISSCTGDGVYMDQGGGWFVKGNHFYGMGTGGINIFSGFNTTIVANYIEDDFGSANASGATYIGISLLQGGGWGSVVQANTVQTSQGGQGSTASQWRCYSIEGNSGASSSSPAVVVVSGNSAVSTVASGTTHKAVGFNYATAGGASSLQVRAAGNFTSPSGWSSAQNVDNPANTLVNAVGTAPDSPLGLPLALSGATTATRYVGGTAAGAPSSGTFAVGDLAVAGNGHVFVCTTAGTPGTWTDAATAPAQGLIGIGSMTSTVSLGTGGYTQVLTLSANLIAGRTYRIETVHGAWVDGASWGEIQSALTYTTDGTTPTPSSPSLVHGATGCPSGGQVVTAAYGQFYRPTANMTIKLCLCAIVQVGSTGGVYGVAPWPCWASVTDLGAVITSGSGIGY